jgi:hypothetical protein
MHYLLSEGLLDGDSFIPDEESDFDSDFVSIFDSDFESELFSVLVSFDAGLEDDDELLVVFDFV